MKTIVLCAVAALALAACSTETKTVEQSTSPAAGAAPMSYPAHNMAEFDSAMQQADDSCYKGHNLERAKYVDRTLETASFECVAK